MGAKKRKLRLREVRVTRLCVDALTPSSQPLLSASASDCWLIVQTKDGSQYRSPSHFFRSSSSSSLHTPCRNSKAILLGLTYSPPFSLVARLMWTILPSIAFELCDWGLFSYLSALYEVSRVVAVSKGYSLSSSHPSTCPSIFLHLPLCFPL